MKKSRLNRRRVLEQQGKTVEFARVDFEMVTDDILQLQIYFDLTEESMVGSAWVMALAVDVVGLAFDEFDPPSFLAFALSFNQAWNMIQARAPRKRKEAANIRSLPPFLGGSDDPPGA